MVRCVTGRKNCAQGSTLGGNRCTMINRRNRRAGGVVRARFGPRFLHDVQTAEDAGHVLDPADMILVGMRQDDAVQLIGVGEFAQAAREIFGPLCYTDTGIQQKWAAARPDNISVGAGTGEWAGIMSKY